MPEQNPTILIVDDEPDILDTLELFLEQDYHILTATSGAEGLNLLSQNRVALIISDQRMPQMEGSEFLEQAREVSPESLRIILTGFSDYDAIVEAVNRGQIHRYIAKPWEPRNLEIDIREAVEIYQMRAELEIAGEKIERQNKALKEQVELFRKFVPSTLSRALNREGFDVREGLSQEETYSVLSCDIRNFTTFSETITCTECFRFMNSYFTIMEPGVRDFEGFVYQFIGDEIMGLFPLDGGGYADNAVQSAVTLRNQILIDYNQGRKRAGYEPIRIGIGINTGPVAVGVAGTPERMDACVLGNTVNVAARCQGLTKEYDADIIITEYTRRHLKEPDSFDIRSLGMASIRGLEQEVHLYGVFNPDP